MGGQSTETFAFTCPHCGKSFEAELIEGPSDRLRGFKCPHCRLFTPYARADLTEESPARASREP